LAGSSLLSIRAKRWSRLLSNRIRRFEQAQQDYLDWVAAISGQMGERTATGFRLESAAIKVFERKAAATRTNASQDNLSPATSPRNRQHQEERSSSRLQHSRWVSPDDAASSCQSNAATQRTSSTATTD